MAGAEATRAWREVPTLVGSHVRLEPLSVADVPSLSAARNDSALDGLWFTNLPGRDACAAYVESALAQQDRGECLPFAVRDAAGTVVGSTRLYGLEFGVPSALVGYTWYEASVQRTGLNTEAKLLLLQYAFEVLGCIRVGFETSVHNARSRAAILRLGAQQEGILRNHKRHADGSPRDTVVFSITDGEWPVVKRSLQDKLQVHGARQ